MAKTTRALGGLVILCALGAGASAEDTAGPTTKARPTLDTEAAAAYSAKNAGRTMLVMVDGELVFERYSNGATAKTATHLFSATKGFWGPVVAAMIEDGLIESFDEPAIKTLPEWKSDPQKSRITLRHLLNLSAGLDRDLEKLQGHARETLADDLYKQAIHEPLVFRPGTRFQYGPVCYYALGEILKRKLKAKKQSPRDYLKARILDPIGVTWSKWVEDKSGNPHLPNGSYFTAREWIKYGRWLLQKGTWKGKPIVKRELFEELLKPSEQNAGHGLALWLNTPGGYGVVRARGMSSSPDDEGGAIYRDGHPDLFAAMGAGKCRMYMIPKRNMVVLRQADAGEDELDQDYDDSTFLSLLLTGKPGTPPGRGAAGAGGGIGRRIGDRLVKRFDRNSDGKVTRDELPPRMARRFEELDSDRNGSLDGEELREVLRRVRGGR